jgi:CheY-like chemotaxis protein
MNEAAMAGTTPQASRYYTSHQVGNLLQVNPSSVVKWINDGLLQAFRTPGGHRRVAAVELVRFAQHHGMPVPDELQGLTATKVVVADDETRFLSAFQRAVKPFYSEIELHTAENGVDALVLIGQVKPDILVIDLRMPGVDGFQVLERLHANPETAAITMIAISGEMSDSNAAQCREFGAVETLQKPVRLPALVETIRQLAQRSRRAHVR